MKEKIREILYEIRPDSQFDDSTNFWQDGLLDSVDIMELIDAIENAYAIEIDLEYIKGTYFSSYDTIVELIRKAKKE